MKKLLTFEELKRVSIHYQASAFKPRTIAVIPVTTSAAKVRAAGYCRVSTDHEDQKSSIAIQEQHMASVLASHPEWENAGLYIDIASGTKTEKRPELQRLMNDCRAGRVNLILTKSISRFARSTTDLLEMVRTLTGLGATLIFDKEHIDTSTMDTEFLLTVLASLAADESLSIASNTRWGLQKRFSDGSYRPSVAPYGYDLVDRRYEVNDAEAAVVKDIFRCFLEGQSMHRIVTSLNERGVSTKRTGQMWRGKPVTGKWSNTVVHDLLMNEAYLGTIVLQKTTKDAAFNRVVNRGQLPMYRIIEHHPPIIDPATFNAAQDKLKAGSKPQGPKVIHPFSQKLICGRCGQHFNRYTNAADRVYWRCRSRILSPDSCLQPGILEKKLEQLFMNVVAELQADDRLVHVYLSTLRSPQVEIMNKLAEVNRGVKRIGPDLSADCISQRNLLLKRKMELEAEIGRLKTLEEAKTEQLLQEINNASGSTRFDGQLFLRIIDHVTMADVITFNFIGGLAMTRELPNNTKGKN